jgi:hypothetical protein
MQGLEQAETGGAFVALDRFTQSYSAGEDIAPFSTSDGMAQGEEPVVTEEGADEEDNDRETVISVSSNVPIQGARPTALNRQSTLLTAGANPSRRSRELTRLLQPTGKNGVITLGSIAGSPTPSSVSTAYTSSTRQGAPSRAGTSVSALSSAPPLILEGAKSTSKARVELDLMLETPLVVEGGILKGRLEIRVRKPKDKEGEVWVGRPKVRVVGFEGKYSSSSSTTRSTANDNLYLYRVVFARRATHLLPPRKLRLFHRRFERQFVAFAVL